MHTYSTLIIKALHSLSAKWRDYLRADEEVLPTLPAVEWLVINDAQPFSTTITVEQLLVMRPYLPGDHAYRALESLVGKGILEMPQPSTYRFTPRTLTQIDTIERAMQACAESSITLSRQQIDRLAIYTSAIVDGINYGPNPIKTPIFHFLYGKPTPSEHALPQVQQRLISLLAFRDDAHIAAWHEEGYSAPAIACATELVGSSDPWKVADLLALPLIYDSDYVMKGLKELTDAEDAVEDANGYLLTPKGAERRKRVEQLTDKYFDAPIEKWLSSDALKDWVQLLHSLIESARTTLMVNRPPSAPSGPPPTVSLPAIKTPPDQPS